MGVGLKAILEKVIPHGRRRAVPAISRQFAASGPRSGSSTTSSRRRLFVSAQCRTSAPLRHKTILLCNGAAAGPCRTCTESTYCTSEEDRRTRYSCSMQHGGAPPRARHRRRRSPPQSHSSRDREAEVLALIARGLYEQGDRRPPANRADDGHLPPPQHHGKARHPLGGRDWRSTRMTAGYVDPGDEL